MLINKNNINNRVLISVTKIYVEKISGFVAHGGARLNFQEGEPLVLHRNPSNDTHLSTIDEFSDGGVIIEKTTINATPKIVARINKKLLDFSKYKLVNNCEHLVNEVMTGKQTSEQLEIPLLVSASATLLAATNVNNRNVSTLLTTALLTGLFTHFFVKKNLLK